MYQAQVTLFIKAETRDQCWDRLEDLLNYMKTVEAEGMFPGLYDIESVKPDKVREREQL